MKLSVQPQSAGGKSIRTELVKMASEASFLPTDLKKRNMFPKLPKSRLQLHECLNVFEIKTCKGELPYISWQMTLNGYFYVQTEFRDFDQILIDVPCSSIQYMVRWMVIGHYMLPNKTQDTYVFVTLCVIKVTVQNICTQSMSRVSELYRNHALKWWAFSLNWWITETALTIT